MAANAPLPPKGDQKKAEAPKKEKKTDKPSKPRAPRQDYGFAKDAVIRLNTTEEKKYRGKRLEMYEALQKSNGKTVEQFLEANKNENDPPRGWLRFFVQDNACTLEGGTKPAEKKEDKPKA